MTKVFCNTFSWNGTSSPYAYLSRFLFLLSLISSLYNMDISFFRMIFSYLMKLISDIRAIYPLCIHNCSNPSKLLLYHFILLVLESLRRKRDPCSFYNPLFCSIALFL